MTKKKGSSVNLKPWTIFSSNETRNAAKLAAKKQGYNLMPWVDMAIMVKATEVLKGKKEVAKPEDVKDVIIEMIDKMLSEKFNKLSKELNTPWWKKMIK